MDAALDFSALIKQKLADYFEGSRQWALDPAVRHIVAEEAVRQCECLPTHPQDAHRASRQLRGRPARP